MPHAINLLFLFNSNNKQIQNEILIIFCSVSAQKVTPPLQDYSLGGHQLETCRGMTNSMLGTK